MLLHVKDLPGGIETELARLDHLSAARVSQIMTLPHQAPASCAGTTSRTKLMTQQKQDQPTEYLLGVTFEEVSNSDTALVDRRLLAGQHFPHMHVVVGIREARQAVVDAQNSVNRVLTGERTI